MEAASSFSLASGLIARRNRNGLPSASICARGTVQVSRPGSVSGEGFAVPAGAGAASGAGTGGAAGAATGASATAAIPFTFSTTSLLPGAMAPRKGPPAGRADEREGRAGRAAGGAPARNPGPDASRRDAADRKGRPGSLGGRGFGGPRRRGAAGTRSRPPPRAPSRARRGGPASGDPPGSSQARGLRERRDARGPRTPRGTKVR